MVAKNLHTIDWLIDWLIVPFSFRFIQWKKFGQKFLWWWWWWWLGWRYNYLPLICIELVYDEPQNQPNGPAKSSFNSLIRTQLLFLLYFLLWKCVQCLHKIRSVLQTLWSIVSTTAALLEVVDGFLKCLQQGWFFFFNHLLLLPRVRQTNLKCNI